MSVTGRVLVDIPDFGLGPVSTFLALAAKPQLAGVRWSALTGRVAAEFLRRNQSIDVNVLEVDTFRPENWETALRLMPKGARLLSITNPHFAGYAAARGWRTAVVDLLSWMWTDAPTDTSVELYLAQHYYGSTKAPDGAVVVQPILDASHWHLGKHRISYDSASISLGGLNMPKAESEARLYAVNVVAGLAHLVSSAGIRTLHIFGTTSGLNSALKTLRTSVSVEVVPHDMAPVVEYSNIVRSSRYYFAMPGLGAINEAAATGLRPLFLPGVSMSMLIQARDLARAGYEGVLEWGWSEQYLRSASQISEVLAMEQLARRLRYEYGRPFATTFAPQLTAYLNSPPPPSTALACAVLHGEQLAQTEQAIAAWLGLLG